MKKFPVSDTCAAHADSEETYGKHRWVSNDPFDALQQQQ